MGKGSPEWDNFNLLAHVDPLGETTLLTQHIAAPVEPTIAALAACLFQDVMSTAAAQ